MGFDLHWIDRGASELLPEEFTYRYQGGSLFYSLVLDSDAKFINNCGCPMEEHKWGCVEPASVRPGDFDKLRLLLLANKLQPIFFRMVDYLEANSNVYLSFSN